TTRDRALLATGAAALWALHPIQTQAVTYIVQRMTVLCGLFSLLAMWRYVRGVRTGERRDFLWSAAFYALALMSKESAAALPVVGLLYEWIVADPSREIGARRRRRIALAIAMIPPIILAGTYAALSDQHFALGTLPGRDYTLFERILSAPRVYFKGMAMLLWPSGQALDHAMVVSRGLFTPWTTFVGWLAMGALIFVTIFTRREHRRSAWALLSFLVLQLPENSFLNLELFFEHRLYLPSALLLPLVPIGLARIVASKNELRAPVTAAILALLALSAGLTVRRNLMWSDPVALMQSNLQVTPGNARAHYNLGQTLARAGDDEGALRAYKEAEARGYDEATFALATTLHRMGQIPAAKAAYQRALKQHPRPAEVWVNLGLLYKQEGDLGQADRAYEWALEFEPKNTDALLNLGNLRLKQGRPEEAETVFTGIIAEHPEMAQAHFNRMLARIAQNKKEEAREDYHAALARGFEQARTYAGYFGEQ
ncbi:MAG: tetratricopeptide repeat protein, partial [Chrysiogenetes bacterium]|nr:tetratricopeptide repeat protein [Chrysiogenetes bacterium]